MKSYNLGRLVLIAGCLLLLAAGSEIGAAQLKGKTDCEWGSDGCNRCAPNVVYQFNTLRQFGDILGFHTNGIDVTVAKHWQGIQRLSGVENCRFIIVTRSLDISQAGFAVVDLNARGNPIGDRFRSNRLERDKIVDETIPPSTAEIVHYEKLPLHPCSPPLGPGDFPYHHAGGIQAVGKYLFVPAEKTTYPEPYPSTCYAWIACYDFADPLNPQYKFRIDVPEELEQFHAGSVAVTQLQDGRYLLLLATVTEDKTGNPKPVFIFLSRNRSLDTNPLFELKSTWYPPVYHAWGLGDQEPQGISIVTDCVDGELYLFAMENQSDITTGSDYIYLNHLLVQENNGEVEVEITPLADRHCWCYPGDNYLTKHDASGSDSSRLIPESLLSIASGGNNCNFDAASGVYVDEGGRIVVYATEHDNDGPKNENESEGTVKMEEFRSQVAPTSCATIDDAWVELYENKGPDGEDESMMIDFRDRHKENYSQFNSYFESEASAARWCMPSGFRYELYADYNWSPSYLGYSLTGTGSTEEIGDFGSFNDAARSGRFEGDCNGEWVWILNPMDLDGPQYNVPLDPAAIPFPIMIAGQYSVPSGMTLQVRPGASVKFAPNTQVVSAGTFVANYGGIPTILESCSSPGNRIVVRGGSLTVRNGGRILFR